MGFGQLASLEGRKGRKRRDGMGGRTISAGTCSSSLSSTTSPTSSFFQSVLSHLAVPGTVLAQSTTPPLLLLPPPLADPASVLCIELWVDVLRRGSRPPR